MKLKYVDEPEVVLLCTSVTIEHQFCSN